MMEVLYVTVPFPTYTGLKKQAVQLLVAHVGEIETQYLSQDICIQLASITRNLMPPRRASLRVGFLRIVS